MFELVETRGHGRECGRQHGETARDQVRRSVDYYRGAFEKATGLSWAEVLELVPRWLPTIEEYSPELIDEVRGIAEGAGLRFEEVLALNGRGELAYGNPFDEAAEGCTSWAALSEATGTGHVYCGQNWDWRSETLETVVLLSIEQPGKPTVIMQTEAGQVGRQGANSAGIGLNANGLGVRLAAGVAIGVPAPFVRRKILDSVTMNDALSAIFSARHRFSTNLLLSHRDGFVIDIETTPGRDGWMYPEDGLLVHGNHFQAFIPEPLAGSYRPDAPDSLYRIDRARRGLRKLTEAKDEDAVVGVVTQAMSDHFGYPYSVCNHPDEDLELVSRTQTVMSSLVDLTTGEYWLAAGNPCQEPFRKLPVNLYAGHAAAV